jgi:hypothetical protein
VTDVAALAAEVAARRRELDLLAGRAQQVASAGKAAEAEIAALEYQAGLTARVAALLTTIGEQAQESARARFEDLATRALQVIFGAELSFGLVPGESGGQPTLEPVIRSDYGGTITQTSVMDARGGGMAEVTGFVMRLVMLLLTPGARRVLFLDESFGFVSDSFTARVAEFLREVADKAQVQIVLITHDPVYAQHADQCIRLVPGERGRARAVEGESELWPGLMPFIRTCQFVGSLK